MKLFEIQNFLHLKHSVEQMVYARNWVNEIRTTLAMGLFLALPNVSSILRTMLELNMVNLGDFV